jgi:tRNA dimethylallyltransferase
MSSHSELESAPPLLTPWYLSGPTAAGKTEIGLALAERLNGEIISLDSMAVYRGMDIGTAKPSRENRRRCPHHLIDLVDPTEEFSVSQFVALAHDTVDDICKRGKTPVFVGGTPLYLKTMLRGLYFGPPPDWEFRDTVELEAERVGLESLHARLAQVDPLSAAKLHVHDKRRIIRALEVHHLTGTPLGHHQSHFEDARPAAECHVFILGWERGILHERINDRIDDMFRVGLQPEVEALLEKYGSLGRTAAQALGYREVIRHLDGKLPLSEAIEKVKARTRQFARRQETWFRSLTECRRVEMGEKSFAEIVDEMVAAGD